MSDQIAIAIIVLSMTGWIAVPLIARRALYLRSQRSAAINDRIRANVVRIKDYRARGDIRFTGRAYDPYRKVR